MCDFFQHLLNREAELRRKKAYLHWLTKDDSEVESRLIEAEEDIKYVLTLLKESDVDGVGEDDDDDDDYESEYDSVSDSDDY